MRRKCKIRSPCCATHIFPMKASADQDHGHRLARHHVQRSRRIWISAKPQPAEKVASCKEFYKRKVEKKDNPLYNEQILFISPPGDIQPFRQRLHSSMPVKVPSGYGNARNNVLIQSAYNVELFTMIAHILTTAKRFALGFMLALCTFATAATAANTETPIPSFITLCYHNVVPALGNGILDDTAPVSQEELKTHFDWLKENGYHIISVKDVLKAKETGKPLPPKSVLLSFDDGYSSFYEIVYPMLKSYGYTAVLSLETGWLETPEGELVEYGGRTRLPRSAFLNWQQIREMADSGIVELASHSHNLHRGHQGNPQGIELPAGAHRLYDAKTGQYETVEAFKQRILDDWKKSYDIIYSKTGHRPLVAVWPYGRYNQVGVQAAQEAGYPLTASLAFFSDWPTIPRLMMHEEIDLPRMMRKVEAGVMGGSTDYRRRNAMADLPVADLPIQRVMHVDLDMIYDENPVQRQKNTSLLFDRIQASGANVIYLQAFADPDGNGTADELYFPNRHLPMRSDFFNYISWQLATRYKCEVYAWLPILGFDLKDRPVVQAVSPDKKVFYTRLTPFDADNRRIINEIYEDLATHAPIMGIIFHDDGIIGDFEDVSPAGKAWLKSIGLPDDPEQIRKDPKLMHTFTRAKSRALIDFTKELQATVEKWHPPVFTSRNMYAPVILTPQAEEWMAQNFDDFLTTYDYTGVEAMPYMEGAADHADQWMQDLIDKVAQHPLGLRRTVFELQAKDWRPENLRPMPNEIMVKQMQQLLEHGAYNFGYYPDDPIIGHPDVRAIAPYFSARH